MRDGIINHLIQSDDSVVLSPLSSGLQELLRIRL